MTDVASAEPRHDEAVDTRRRPTPTVRSTRRLGPHAVVLAVVLFALLRILDNGAMITADEGAVLSQAQVVHDGRWALENPAPSIDPTGKWFGIEGTDQVGQRFFPYAKHAAYPALMSVLLGWGGVTLVIAASVAATVAAAVLAALLARRLQPDDACGLDIVTLWVVGLASPLFFDGYMVTAHSIGAAFAALTCLSVLRWWSVRHPTSDGVEAVGGTDRAPTAGGRWLVVAALGIVGAVFVRSEGMILGASLAVVLGALAIAHRDRLAVVVAGCCAAVTVGTWWLDGVIHSRIVGDAQQAYVVTDTDAPWLQGRIDGAWASLLRPQLTGLSSRGIVLLGVVGAAGVAAAYASRRRDETAIIRGLAVLSGAGAITVLGWNWSPVPGLLVACPLVPVGLAALRRSHLSTSAARLLLATSALYAVGIVATQYSIGGGMEWGGRFFHMVLPLAAPVLLAALADVARSLDRTTRRVAMAGAATVSAVLVVVAMGTIVRMHDMSGDLVDAVHDVSMTTSSAQDPRGPVVVSNLPSLGRFAWRDAVRSRYLMVPSADLAELDARLVADGVDELVFAAALQPDEDVAAFEHYRVDTARSRAVGDWQLFVLTRVR